VIVIDADFAAPNEGAVTWSSGSVVIPKNTTLSVHISLRLGDAGNVGGIEGGGKIGPI
jgi:hypothetical protein